MKTTGDDLPNIDTAFAAGETSPPQNGEFDFDGHPGGRPTGDDAESASSRRTTEDARGRGDAGELDARSGLEGDARSESEAGSDGGTELGADQLSAPASTEPEIDPWDAAMQRLGDRFPTASPGILFCVHKLEQDPELTLRDFRDEALMHGLRLSGRSLHSAKVLLGYEKPATRRRKVDAEPAQPTAPAPEPPERSPLPPTSRRASTTASVEESLIAAVQEIQDSATRDSKRLRSAVQEAIQVLQRALDGLD